MKLAVRALKCFSIVSVFIGLVACSALPDMNIFPDKKDDYKRSHELPSLEIPPELTGGSIRDEYDGAARGTAPLQNNQSVAQTFAMDEALAKVELLEEADLAYLLVRDSMRNAWRLTLAGLEEFDYEVDDKNRVNGLVYLEIPQESESGMLSSLSFWASAETNPYIVSLKRVDTGIAIRVLNEQQESVKGAVSEMIYADLLEYITK